MNKSEEMVYSLMGLDPILILEEPPISENYTVNIIRPGEDNKEGAEEKNILPDGIQQNKLNHSNVKNKINHKNIVRLKENKSIEENSNNPEESENIKGKDISVDLSEEINELINTDNTSINENDELISAESKEVNEDPRRKRRRSSASS